MHALSDLLDQVGNLAAPIIFVSRRPCWRRAWAIRPPPVTLSRQRPSSRNPWARRDWPRWPEPSIAMGEKSADTGQLLDASEPLCRDDPTAAFHLACTRAQWALESDPDARQQAEAREQLHALRQEAVAASRGDWLCLAEQLLFLAGPAGPGEVSEPGEQVDPAERPDVQCRDLLSRHRVFLGDVAKARLLAITTERLATAGSFDEAREFFALAQHEIQTVATTIASPDTRQAYLKQASAPLQRAVLATGDALPLFMADARRASSREEKSLLVPP